MACIGGLLSTVTGSVILTANEVKEVEDHIDQLDIENAELRKLVKKLHKCVRGMLRDLAPSCVDSDMEGCGMDCTENGENCCMALLEQRMHKLGVDTN